MDRGNQQAVQTRLVRSPQNGDVQQIPTEPSVSRKDSAYTKLMHTLAHLSENAMTETDGHYGYGRDYSVVSDLVRSGEITPRVSLSISATPTGFVGPGVNHVRIPRCSLKFTADRRMAPGNPRIILVAISRVIRCHARPCAEVLVTGQ